MAIKLWGNTNIALTNTSFVGDVYPGKKSVPLFTAASNWTYYFEWDIQDSGTIAVSLNINSTPKEIWTYYDSVSHHVSYEFTLVTWDVVEIEVSWYWTGSNLTVTKYADEPKEIYVWEWTLVDDYSAMQWPAPDGFHVPLNTEWQAVYDIWTALWGWSSDWANFWIALKLPFAGYRIFSTAEVGSQGSDGRYWSSSRYDTSNAYYLYFHSTTLGPQNNNRRPNGYSVRCFKNSPTVPTSSWTKLYWTSIEAGWIFWSSTDWLISLSSDWNTWITIADKNLGATTVWNSWDTLSETNAWKYYQRWNNYGFPRARNATITISYTQVDASTYWPWNYYSSSTFIGRSSSPHRWDTTDNWNLRWWVTGVQQEHIWNVIEVYVGTTKVRPSSWQQQSWGSWQWENNWWSR